MSPLPGAPAPPIPPKSKLHLFRGCGWVGRLRSAGFVRVRPRQSGVKSDFINHSPFCRHSRSSSCPRRSHAATSAVADSSYTELCSHRGVFEWKHQHRLVPRTVVASSAGVPNGRHGKHGAFEHPMRIRKATVARALTQTLNVGFGGSPLTPGSLFWMADAAWLAVRIAAK